MVVAAACPVVRDRGLNNQEEGGQMKRVFLMTLAVAVACSGMAFAQNFGTSGSGSAPVNFAPCVLGPDDITQSVDCTIAPFTGISCSAGGIDAGNQYLRRFFLTADHAIASNYTVDAVQFGVEVADPGGSTCAGVPMTFNTYSIAIGAPFLYANMNLLDSTTIDGTGSAGTIVTAAVGGTVNPATDDLVVEVVTCDSSGTGDFASFFPGANGLGEVQPSYIASDSCSIFDPIALDDIGFPANDNVFVVEGSEDGAGCQGAFVGNPRIRRRPSGVTVDFRLDLTHRRSTVSVPIYAEIQDLQGNAIGNMELGLYTLNMNDTVSVRDILRAPSSIAPGDYVLVARIPRMKNLIEFKRMITIP